MGSIHLFFAHYGIWAAALLLLLENAGLPVPGEVGLVYAAHLSQQGKLAAWPELAVVACCACILGDNCGYWVGRGAGEAARNWLRLSADRVGYAQRYFDRYGALTVFFARFVAGLRVIAGPAAGLSRMGWPPFFLANSLGAGAWVTAIVAAGFWLGAPVGRLLSSARGLSLALLAVAVVAILLAMHRIRRERPKGATHET